MSGDFPMTTGIYQQIYRGTNSVFTKNVRQVTNLSNNMNRRVSVTNENEQKGKQAGLNNMNSRHNFLYFNGKQDKPQIFANLLKNSNKHDLQSCFIDEDRFEIHRKFKDTYKEKT